MLYEGRLPLTPAESDAVDALITAHPVEPISLTRADPGESGFLLVHVGDSTYEIDADGQVVS